MKTYQIEGTKREELSKAANKNLRLKEIRIPAVLYGKDEPVHLSVDYVMFEKSIEVPDAFIYEINLEGQTHSAILKDTQFHPTTDKVLHIDFLELSDGKEVEVKLPIELVGNSKGVLNGGKLLTLMRKIKVTGDPFKLPEIVEIDISDLGLGRTITVSDVSIEGLNITSPASAGIAMVEIPRALKQEGVKADD